MNVALITGSRGYHDPFPVQKVLATVELVVVGCARSGADKHAREWAEAFGCMPPRVFVAPWSSGPGGSFNPRAGFDRNQQMVDYCLELALYDGLYVVCHAFWDQRSGGTRDCMDRARRAGLRVDLHSPT